MTFPRLPREDRAPAFWIALLPLLVAVPRLAGWLAADPLIHWGGMTLGYREGIASGWPYIDPNYAVTTHALGVRAALDWMSGVVPWWNPYSGVGLPLAGEYQPAAFFPLTLMLLLPRGMVLQHVALQILAGWGTYGLLRELRVGRGAATIGGLLFAFNGTLAWFAHGPAQPLAFMPWMLWGIERARVPAGDGRARGWRMFGLALAMSLLAGFPETAYLDGLFALAWALVRLAGLERGARVRAALPIALAGLAGLAIAAPQILAFGQFLKESEIGGHAEIFSRVGLPPLGILPSLVAPYANGPIFAYVAQWPATLYVWGEIGGYTTLALLAVAAYGFLVARDRLRWLLLGWTIAALGKTFGIEPLLSAWNYVPGVAATAFFRYAQPTWELAMVIMAAWGLDALASAGRPKRTAWLAACAIVGAVWLAALLYGFSLWPQMRPHVGIRNTALFSALWASASAAACLLLMGGSGVRSRAWLGRVLVADAVLLFAFPTLANPRGGEIDHAGIAFLREHLGLQRFYSLGPIAPNYGAYFGIASIDHNYLPVSERWARWVKEHLDRDVPDPTVFNGGAANAIPALRRNLDAYQWLGVKLVVMQPGQPTLDGIEGVRQVYLDAAMRIYELPRPRPYFEAEGAACTLRAAGREALAADCEGEARLVRRELYFPGWQATVDGKPVRIDEHMGLFQRIALPAGHSEIAFRFAPPHSGWAWLAAALGLAALASPMPRPRALRKGG